VSPRDTVQDGHYPYPEPPYAESPYQAGPYQEPPYQEAPYQADPYQEAPYREAPYPDDDYPQAFYPEYEEPAPRRPQPRPHPKAQPETKGKKKSIDAWMAQPSTNFPRLKRRTIALFFLRLPVFVPWFFVMRGWLTLNTKDVLTLSEADVLGTGGEFFLLACVSITPLITLTGARWFAPLRRWYGIFFALIGISDGTTAAITTNFAGGVFGRLAGHTFLLSGFMIVLIAVPVLLTANTPAQRKLGTYWKKLQKLTYVMWGLLVLHLALLDGFRPFDGPQGDGDPVFHQRFYQSMAISLPLVILRLPPVKRWITETRAAGQQWKVWCAIAPMAALYILAFAFVINEEFFTGLQILTLHPPAN
jgi:DMSO/TMAO reductase YedYZ heme-binding membrane subunit